MRAKRLRREMTDAEKRLWSALRNRQIAGAKFRKQQPIGPYIVDFVCQEKRLILEADGSQHLESPHDLRRDAVLTSKGYRILRFWHNDIMLEMDGVPTAIYDALSAPPSPARGEGFVDGASLG
jgi:very-short-patch-repair endonuclease